MSGWTGMREALAVLGQNAQAAVDKALERTADVAVEDVRRDWPSKTGASAAAWRSEGSAVVNLRPEAEHIQAGRAADAARSTLVRHESTFAAELDRAVKEIG